MINVRGDIHRQPGLHLSPDKFHLYSSGAQRYTLSTGGRMSFCRSLQDRLSGQRLAPVLPSYQMVASLSMSVGSADTESSEQIHLINIKTNKKSFKQPSLRPPTETNVLYYLCFGALHDPSSKAIREAHLYVYDGIL